MINHIILGEKSIKYLLKRSNRKTIGITIDRRGEVIIRAPLFMKDDQIQEILYKKQKWILEKLDDRQSLLEIKKNYKEGDRFLFLGKEYELHVVENNGLDGNVELKNSHINVYIEKMSSENMRTYIRQIILNWYWREARKILEYRADQLILHTGLEPNHIKIKEQKSRFGSCSSLKNINLNWRLVMASEEIIDYVILHELCHLQEMNHSDRFWTLVESFMPDYRQRRLLLKKIGPKLMIEFE